MLQITRKSLSTFLSCPIRSQFIQFDACSTDSSRLSQAPVDEIPA